MMTRVAWTIWALVPILALTYHFGPGQRLYREDKASRLLATARSAQAEAMLAQDSAYEKHLAAIAARRAAFGKGDHALDEAAKRAGDAESGAYAIAAAAWQKTADAIEQAESLLDSSDPRMTQTLQVARARAQIRAGDIGGGADDLEALLESLAERGESDSAVAMQAREELATAYYYGARLLRLAGRPAQEWREVSARSRQIFRYLADHAREGGRDAEVVGNYEKNGELVLDLEQSSVAELYAKPRPKDSPPGAGNRLGQRRPGGRGRRPGPQPGGGAGLDGEIGQGW